VVVVVVVAACNAPSFPSLTLCRAVYLPSIQAVNVQEAGAQAMVVINNVDGENLSMDMSPEERDFIIVFITVLYSRAPRRETLL